MIFKKTNKQTNKNGNKPYELHEGRCSVRVNQHSVADFTLFTAADLLSHWLSNGWYTCAGEESILLSHRHLTSLPAKVFLISVTRAGLKSYG